MLGAEQGTEQHRAEGEASHPVEDFMGAHFDVALAKMPRSQGQEGPRGRSRCHEKECGESGQSQQVGKHKQPGRASFSAAQRMVVRDVIHGAVRQSQGHKEQAGKQPSQG